MALNDSEKHEILFLLGWPGKTIQPLSQLFNTIVDDRLTNLPAAHEARVRRTLKGLKSIDENLDCTQVHAGVSKLDDITYQKDGLNILRRERLRRIRELSDMINIPVMRTGASPNVAVIN